MTIPGLTIIGDRINPGFKSTREILDNEDMAALQALAIRQREAGAAYLDFTIGPRAKDDPAFLVEAIRTTQEAVDLPLCFDYPDAAIQETCLKAYDPDKAGGRKPMINSISEVRQEMMALPAIRPCKVIIMVSERLEDGVRKQNKQAAGMVATAKRMAKSFLDADYGLALDDLIIDVAIGALSSDTEGLTRAALETTRALGTDPDLAGIHMTGGLTNLSAQLPARDGAGAPLKLQIENAFLTIAVPHGFDMVLATPWRGYALLAEDNPVLEGFKEIIALDGLDALRRLRKLYTS